MAERKKKNGLSAGDHSIVIGGNVQGSNIVAGNNNTVGIHNINLTSSFRTIYHFVETHPTLQPAEKQDAKDELKEIQKALEEPKPDEDFLARRFRNLKRMAPDIVEVAFETLKNPISGVATVIQKIASKMAE
ncbi:MAG TPA: hypothetical protein VJ521_00955 [Acidobacteriota bacterium]|nr:hypothetical protein [Acidobacteriota bacterium]